jgi:DNA-binding beta-propeller fold protein YncE
MRGSLATLTLALPILLVLVTPAAAQPPDALAAQSAFGRLVQPRGEDGCIHRKAVNRCARGSAVTSPEDLVISPDGRHAYVASYSSHAVAVFVRNRRTGTLRQRSGRRGCIRQGRGGGCTPARGIGGPISIAISPDGRNVYVVAAGSDALTVFARNRRTGALRQLAGQTGCISQRPGDNCILARALNEPTSVAVSPDGERVYVAARRFPSAVAIFERRAGGMLRQADGPAGCVSHRGGSGCAVARALSGPEEVTVTPDSRHVLVAASRSHAVSVLTAAPSGLTQADGQAGCIALRGGTEGCAAGKALAGPVDLAVSRDGDHVYVASSVADAVAVLDRDEPTGALTQAGGRRGCIGQRGLAGRCEVGRGLDEVWGVTLSPDGRNLYAVSSKVNMLAAIARNRSTGRLVQLPGRLGCFIRGGGFGCVEGRGLTVAVSVAVSPDGRNVYVASEDIFLGAIAIFRRRAP